MGGSDKRLVRRAARGDGRAFEEIYRRYGQDLYRFCLAMTGNRQDAQDALQNTMVKVLRALPGEERQIVLKPWLYRIARNETVEVLRKRRDCEELGVVQATASTVAETVEIREHLRMLLSDLEQLPRRQRAVLLMRELSGLGFTEIGVAFGTSAAAVRQSLYEARLSLQQLQEGRERRCTDVQRELSDADGRVIRRRMTRAHLRHCRECRAFQAAISRRQEDLAAMTALPLAVSAALLRAVLDGSAGAASTGTASAGLGALVGGGVGNAIAGSTVVKSAVTLAVAALAVSATDRGGLVDLPLRDGDDVAVLGSAEVTGRFPPEPAGTTTGHTESGSAAATRKTLPEAGHEVDGQRNAADRATPTDTRPTAKEPDQGGNEPTLVDDTDATGGASPGDSDTSQVTEDLSAEQNLQSEPAAEENGPAEGPSAASNYGQQTAAAHKSEHAKSPHGHGPPAGKPGKPAHPTGGPPAKPTAPSGGPQTPPDRPEAPPAGNPEAPPDEPAAPSADPPTNQPDPPGHSGTAGNGHAHGHKS